MADKLASVADAVAALVRDRDSLVIGACLEAAIPFAAVHEIIRQGRRGLNAIAPISDAATDMLIGAGCVERVTGAWVGNVSGGLAHNYRRAAEQGLPHPIAIEDHSNFSLAMALMAGANGLPYVPVRSLLGSDILKTNRRLIRADDPFSPGKPVILVPACKPDVAILPVQRSDRDGNCHFWGSLVLVQEAALAAERVILLADEIVDTSVIVSDPNRILFPSFRVSAVCPARAGCHPSSLTGVWRRDTPFFVEYHTRSRDREGFLSWLREWVFDVEGHEAYLDKLGDRLERLRITGWAPPEPVNFAAV